jgi:hypothetical protein
VIKKSLKGDIKTPERAGGARSGITIKSGFNPGRYFLFTHLNQLRLKD